MPKLDQTLIAWLSTGIGAAVMLFGIIEDGDVDQSDLRAIGVLVTMTGVAWLIARRVTRPTTAAYELGRADGYREGYSDGREVGKPVVVRFPERAVSTGRHAASGKEEVL